MSNEEKPMSNSQKKKLAAKIHNATMDIANNLMMIGECGYCGKGKIMVYLKSKLENSCTYYCINCDHKGSLKDIDKKDSFIFPLKDIVGEVRKNYNEKEFDDFYNKD